MEAVKIIFLLVPLCFLEVADATGINPCCHYPCQNKGICVNIGKEDYECDCTRTGYYGVNCSLPSFWSQIHTFLKPSRSFVHHMLTHYKWFWDILSGISFIRDSIMRHVLTERSNLIPSPPTYNSDYNYLSWEGYANVSYFTRLLPPVPKDCPTHAGTVGYKDLPDAKQFAEEFLLRRKFIPDPQGTNVMFAFFAQHFTHQFFRTDFDRGPGFTKALGHGVDLTHIYGYSLERQHQLRLFKDGKLKYQVVNGEVVPPSVKDAPIKMKYPKSLPEEKRLAFGHDLFGLVPGLMLYATVWLREHNRVCDILKKEHPTWSDEQLFQTTRLILTGETIKIVIEDYVQHLSGYHFKLTFNPELLFSEHFQYRNRIAVEFDHLYHWHPLMPDSFIVKGQEFPYEEFLFNTDILLNFGVEALVESFSKQRSGRIGGGKNIHKNILHVAIGVIEHGRQLRLQPFNQYRKWFGLTPYKSFQELTGETEIAAQLEKLYGHIDAVEFYPALMLERPYQDATFGESMVEMGAPFSLKGLLGNPICSPDYWKPSTFGGKTGFDIVNTATLEKLVCLNVKKCPYVAFRVPYDIESKDHTKIYPGQVRDCFV
ncbi:prostaglandin G/H synthase 1-like [Scyliorhinus canicula]|uniref:prostaglandin G/H synthase 1-like n=1 Tax=Scyliorhinus canicula TaxID=7830 RepID=UPI0018F5EF54|nr:prostaglandin G/H synthase 1-like [Scyliorhinus canicula]